MNFRVISSLLIITSFTLLLWLTFYGGSRDEGEELPELPLTMTIHCSDPLAAKTAERLGAKIYGGSAGRGMHWAAVSTGPTSDADRFYTIESNGEYREWFPRFRRVRPGLKGSQ